MPRPAQAPLAAPLRREAPHRVLRPRRAPGGAARLASIRPDNPQTAGEQMPGTTSRGGLPVPSSARDTICTSTQTALNKRTTTITLFSNRVTFCLRKAFLD